MGHVSQSPLRSRTVGFPESGSDLGSARHFRGAGLPMGAEAQVLAHIHPESAWFTCPRVPGSTPRLSSSESGYVAEYSEPPSAQSPLPDRGVTRHRDGLESRLRGRYSSFIAHTDSCVRPNPSRCLGRTSHTRSLQVVASPRWEMALPDILSAILAKALGPIPRHVPRMRALIASPRTPASRDGKGVRHVRQSLPGNFYRERNFGAAVIRSSSGSAAR